MIKIDSLDDAMAEDEKTIAKKARKLARKKRRKLKIVNIFEKFFVFF